MSRRIFVSLLPSLVDSSRLPGTSAVMIDVLRASTTICTAIAAGAARVIPFAAVDDARRVADQIGQSGERPLLGGERGGVRIEGFDLGNSPLEYSREAVAGRTILFTTTNGTRALLAAAPADRVYAGAFANRTALADRLAADPGDVHLLCAGTDGQVTLEDAACAGDFVEALRGRMPGCVLGNDEAKIAFELHLNLGDDRNRLDALRSGLGGQNLVALGYDADIEFSARTDSAPVVSVYRDGAITAEGQTSPAEEDGEWAI